MCTCNSSPGHVRSQCDCACHGPKRDGIDYLADFRSRLVQAEKALRQLAQSDPSEVIKARLNGKAEGVNLALSYFDEIQRVRS